MEQLYYYYILEEVDISSVIIEEDGEGIEIVVKVFKVIVNGENRTAILSPMNMLPDSIPQQIPKTRKYSHISLLNFSQLQNGKGRKNGKLRMMALVWIPLRMLMNVQIHLVLIVTQHHNYHQVLFPLLMILLIDRILNYKSRK